MISLESDTDLMHPGSCEAGLVKDMGVTEVCWKREARVGLAEARMNLCAVNT